MQNGKPSYENTAGDSIQWESGGDWAVANLGTSGVPKWTLTAASGRHKYVNERASAAPPEDGWLAHSPWSTGSISVVYEATSTPATATTTFATAKSTITTQWKALCAMPTTPHGSFELLADLGQAGLTWKLACDTGYMPLGGNMVVCSSSGITSAIPTCVADRGCVTTSALQLTSGAISTTCSQKMANQQTCVAVCHSNAARVEGTIKCLSGRLVDSSHCVSDQDVTPIKMTKVFGTVFIGLSHIPTADSVKKAFADAYLTHPDYVSVASDAFPRSDGRLLVARQRTPLRFLSSVIAVDYTVAISPNCSEHSSKALSSAMALSSLKSKVGKAFSQSMKSSGVTVISLVDFNLPIIVNNAIVLHNAAGAIEQPEASSLSSALGDTSMQPEKEGLGVGTALAVVLGSLLFLTILGFLARTCFVIRRRFTES